MTDRFLPDSRAVFERWLSLLTTFRAVLERLLLLWLILICAAAYWWTDWFGGTGAFDPFVWSAPGLPCLIFVTMLAIGSLLPEDEIRQVIQRWPTVLAGTAIQYAAMPLLAYVTGRFLGLEGAWMIGIVMVGCVPGAMASNVLTLMARGNVSYSVSLTYGTNGRDPPAFAQQSGGSRRVQCLSRRGRGTSEQAVLNRP